MEQEKKYVPVIHRLLTGMVNTVCRFPKLVIFTAFALVAASIYLACTQLTFLTQRNDLVSPRREHQQRWRQYVAEFGDDDDMVVVFKGTDRAKMKPAIEKVAKELHQRPKLFDRIFYKVDLRSLHSRALLYLSTGQIRKIQDSLQDMNLLLDPPIANMVDPLFGWKSLTLTQLFGEAQRRASAHRHYPNLSSNDKQFYIQLQSICDSASRTLKDPKEYQSPWKSILPEANDQQDLMAEPQYFFSGDGTLAFLLARPVKDMSSFTSAQASINQLRKIVDQTKKEFPEIDLGLTGLPVLENDEMTASQMSTATASWLALIGVSLLYLLVYRCIRYPFLTVTTLLVGTVWALGWLTITVGHLNILSATFAVMLIGLGDYGVLWVTRYEQERANGHEVQAAMRLTMVSTGPSIVTAAMTTALAFYCAMFADFRAVSELGWIAGSGVILCALSCFALLPAMVKMIDRQDAAPKMTLRLASRTEWLPSLNRHPHWLVAGALLLTLVSGYFAFKVYYDHNLLNLQAKGLDSVQWEMTLIKHTSGAGWHALSTTTTPEEALALKARYEKLPGVDRVVEVASLIPREQELKLVLLRDIQHRLRSLPKRGAAISHLPPNPEFLTAKITQLRSSLAVLNKDKDGVVDGLRSSLDRLKQLISQTDRDVAVQRISLFEQWLTRDLAEDLHRLRDVSTAQSITTADLPKSLRERYIGKSGKWLLRIFGKGSLWEFNSLEKFAKQIVEVDPDATGKPFSTLEGLSTVRKGFLWATIYAFIAMVVVLLIDFRNVAHTVISLLPLLVGVAVSLGIMGFFGLPLNPANMIALPLILGLGADNGVHILHDFLARRKDRPYALSYSTGRGILVAALTTVFGFGTLMISHHRGLSGLGLLLTIGVSSCTLTALLFMPSMLRLFTMRGKQVTEKTIPLDREKAA